MVIEYGEVLIKLLDKYNKGNITEKQLKILDKLHEWYLFGMGKV